jgi:hypothetical protein
VKVSKMVRHQPPAKEKSRLKQLVLSKVVGDKGRVYRLFFSQDIFEYKTLKIDEKY